MFIKLTFKNPISSKSNERIIKISRIQEIRPNDPYGSEIKISGDKEFKRVDESVDEIFGVISK